VAIAQYATSPAADLSARSVALLARWNADLGGDPIDPASVSGCLYCLDGVTLAAFKALLLGDILLELDGEAEVTPLEACVACRSDYLNVAYQVEALEGLVSDSEVELGCFYCRPEILPALEVQLLSSILLRLDVGADVSVAGLAARAACLACDPGLLTARQTGMFGAIHEGGGGGGGGEELTTEGGEVITTEDGQPITTQ
jgi:hypothetical protein